MNHIKTFFLLMVLTGLLLLIGAAIGGEVGVVIAVIFALAMNFGAYWFSDKIALSMAHARPITADDDPELYQLVAEQARLANMPMPKVYEIDEPSPNAFATGRNPQNATVAVTTGIRYILTREELAGVMAHEMAHVGNRDTLIMTIVATIAGAITMLAFIAQFAAIFSSFGGHSDDDEGGGGNIITLLIIAIIMPIAATFIRMAISPRPRIPGRPDRRPQLRQPRGPGPCFRKARNGQRDPSHEGQRGSIPPVHRQPAKRPLHGTPLLDSPAHRGARPPPARDERPPQLWLHRTPRLRHPRQQRPPKFLIYFSQGADCPTPIADPSMARIADLGART